MTTAIDHSRASHLVANFNHTHRAAANLFNETSLRGENDKQYHLEFPTAGTNFYAIRVSFYHVEGHPEWMRVSSTNWRCEDEPNDIYPISLARSFYKQLTANGFQAF